MSQLIVGLPTLAIDRFRVTEPPASTSALSDVGVTSSSGGPARSAIGMRATGIVALFGVSTSSPKTVWPCGSCVESADSVIACVAELASVNDDGDSDSPLGMPLNDAVQVTGAVRVLFTVRGNVHVPTQVR